MSNREIDALVQKTFFPWDESRCRVCGSVIGKEIRTLYGRRQTCFPSQCGSVRGDFKRANELPPPNYSTDPAASKQLQDKLNELKWYWRIERAPSGAAAVSIWGNFGTVVTMRGAVVETVFALAALKAVGVQEEEK